MLAVLCIHTSVRKMRNFSMACILLIVPIFLPDGAPWLDVFTRDTAGSGFRQLLKFWTQGSELP